MRTITVTHEIDCEAEYCGQCEKWKFDFASSEFPRCRIYNMFLKYTKKTDEYRFRQNYRRLPECIKAETNVRS